MGIKRALEKRNPSCELGFETESVTGNSVGFLQKPNYIVAKLGRDVKSELSTFTQSVEPSTAMDPPSCGEMDMVDIDPNTWNQLQSYVMEWYDAVEETKTHDYVNLR